MHSTPQQRGQQESPKTNRWPMAFSTISLIIEGIVIVLYGVFMELDPSSDMKGGVTTAVVAETLQSVYPLFEDVQVMVFVGFGLLLAYLRHHSWSAIGKCYLVGVFSIQIYPLFRAFWWNIFRPDGSGHTGSELNILMFLSAAFCAVAVLISFCGIIGKVSPLQLMIMTIAEVGFYSLNEIICQSELKILDIGGSIIIHTFGAYFGLIVSWIISPSHTRDHPKNQSGYLSNIFAITGTVFLWIYWPSFNGAAGQGAQMHRSIMNTILSLTGSVICTFLISGFTRGGKFHMEHVANATLAGGVVMGAAADFVLHPFAAILTGAVAGAISTLGFEYVSPFLQQKISLYDTAGIHNLHGMPGVMGGVVSAIYMGTLKSSQLPANTDPSQLYPMGRTPGAQAGAQIAAIGVTMFIAIASGIVTGLTLKIPIWGQPQDLFEDSEFWVIDDEAPIVAYKPAMNHDNSPMKMSNIKVMETEKGTA